MSYYPQMQQDSNRAVATNIRNEYLNTVVPLILAVLKNGVMRKNDNSLFSKDQAKIDEILRKYSTSNSLRAWVETSEHSKRIGINCDIRFAICEHSCDYTKIHVELANYDGEPMEQSNLDTCFDSNYYADVRQMQKIAQDNFYKQQAIITDCKRILER
jgi:hypothetical protein